MRLGAIVIVLVIAGIGVVGALQSRSGARLPDRSGERTTAIASQRSSKLAVPTRTRDPAAAGDDEDHQNRGDHANHEGDDSESADEPEVVSVDGIVSVVDADGREHRDESGELVLLRYTESDDPKREVAKVAKGRFRIDVPRSVACFGVILATLNGRPVDFDACDIHRYSDRPVTLHARRARPFRVRVVDATTGLDLHGVTIVRFDDDVNEETLSASPIPPDAVFLRDAASPLDFEATVLNDEVEWDPRFHVTAAGHAWAEIPVDFKVGGEIVVPLPRSGRLRVKIAGAPEMAQLVVCSPADPMSPEDQEECDRVGFRPRGDCFVDVPARNGEPILLDSVPVGPLVVTVEVGLDPCAIVVAESEVVLAPDETREVTLECRRIERPRRIAVSGTIEIQGEWKDSPFSIELRPVRPSGMAAEDFFQIKSVDMDQVSEEPFVLRWKAVDLIPTDYAVSILEFCTCQVLHVAEGGSNDVKIVVGPCGDATIHFVDTAVGAAVDVGYEVRWFPEGASSPYDGCYLDHDYEHELYKQQVPVGRGCPFLNYFGDSEWILDDATPVDIHFGDNDLTFHVHRKCGVKLKLQCAATRIAWPERGQLSLDAEPEDETGFSESDVADGGHLALVAHPGRFRVTLPPIPGFEPVPPFEIEICAGPYGERVVELHRKR